MRRRFPKLARANLLLGGLLLISAPTWAQRPLGCDVSDYQPSVNWTQVTNSGVVFCWAKATQGTSYDYATTTFDQQEAGGTSAHVYMGAYHFAMPSVNPNITGANS